MTTYTPAQDGYIDTDGWPPPDGVRTWIEDRPINRFFGTDGAAGLIFNLPIGFYTSLTLVLRGKIPTIIGTNHTLNLYMVSSPAPDLWSQTNQPQFEVGPLVASIAVTGEGLWVFLLDMNVVGPIITQPGWTGRIALALTMHPDNFASARAFASSRNSVQLDRPFLEVNALPSPPDHPGEGYYQVFILRNYQILAGKEADSVTAVGLTPGRTS